MPMSFLFHCPCHQQSQVYPSEKTQIAYVDRPIYIPAPPQFPISTAEAPIPVSFYNQQYVQPPPMGFNPQSINYITPSVIKSVEEQPTQNNIIPDVTTSVVKENLTKVIVPKLVTDLGMSNIGEKKVKIVKETSVLHPNDDNIIVNVVGGQRPTEVIDTTHLNANIDDEQLSAENFDHNLQTKVVKVHKTTNVHNDEDFDVTNLFDTSHLSSNIFNEQIEGANFKDNKRTNVIVKKVITKKLNNPVNNKQVMTRFGNNKASNKKRVIAKIIKNTPGRGNKIIKKMINTLNIKQNPTSNGALLSLNNISDNKAIIEHEEDTNNDYLEEYSSFEEDDSSRNNSSKVETLIMIDNTGSSSTSNEDDKVFMVKNNEDKVFQLVPADIVELENKTQTISIKELKKPSNIKFKKVKKPFVEINAAKFATEAPNEFKKLSNNSVITFSNNKRTTLTTTMKTSIQKRKFQKTTPKIKTMIATSSPSAELLVKNDNTIETTINDEEYDIGPQGPNTIQEETIEYIESDKDFGSSPAPPEFFSTSTSSYEIDNNRISIDQAALYESESTGYSSTYKTPYRKILAHGTKTSE